MRCENSNGAMGSLAIFFFLKTWTCNGYFFALPDQIFLSLSACWACGPEEKAYTYQRQRLDTYLLACLFIPHWCQEDIGIFKETLLPPSCLWTLHDNKKLCAHTFSSFDFWWLRAYRKFYSTAIRLQPTNYKSKVIKCGFFYLHIPWWVLLLGH